LGLEIADYGFWIGWQSRPVAGGVTMWNPFDRPRPTADCLMHEALLVQAWKKAHAYIRSRNWYADVLELDLSVVNLQAQIAAWRRAYERDGAVALRPSPMRLIPAPKTGAWEFDHTKVPAWRPDLDRATKNDSRPVVLRPLAHLSIRDQTLAIAVMICLADLVESLQGDPSQPVVAAITAGVSSYGNRLHCEWRRSRLGYRKRRAEFAWGNITSYRKYYTDYQAFLARPRHVYATARQAHPRRDQLGVVSLDLTAFYDRIQPKQVIEILREACGRHGVESDDEFWVCAEQILAWRWADENLPVEQILRDGLRPDGLPQGLVASGFFSNVYMLAFDEAVRREIAKSATKLPFRVLDYCRYVDDMRLTVQCNEGSAVSNIAPAVVRWVNRLLRKHAPHQRCNPRKTEVLSDAQLSAKGSRSAAMELIQHRISGPLDMEAMDKLSLELDGLLNSIQSPGGELPRPKGEGHALELVMATSIEVRDDTVKRFGAYRQFKTLREQRRQAGDDVTSDGDKIRRKVDGDIEIAARRMVNFWAFDPSLTIVLRHAMNLLPAPALLQPVLVALREWIKCSDKANVDVAARWTALYVATDLLKAGTVETAVGSPAESLPAKSDVQGYRIALAKFANWILSPERAGSVPWYVKQQAILFRLSQGHDISITSDVMDPALRDCGDMVRVMRGQLQNIKSPDQRIVPLVIVADQMRGDGGDVIGHLARWLGTVDTKVAVSIATQLYLANRSLFHKLWNKVRNDRGTMPWCRMVAKSFVDIDRRPVASVHDLGNNKIPLTTVAGARDNPFTEENAVLQLILALLAQLDNGDIPDGQGISPQRVLLSCNDWTVLSDPSVSAADHGLKVDLKAELMISDPRYAIPAWCPPRRKWLMALGRIIRMAITGNPDYSAPVMPNEAGLGRYVGIKTSWYKRQHGLLNRPDALGGPQSGCSPWISELLSKMLLWPGCREVSRMIKNWRDITSIASLRALVKSHLADQRAIYGGASNLPVYLYPVGMLLKRPPILTAVLIQTVRPWRRDFTRYGAQLDRPGFRAIRRGHLASVLRLAEKQLDIRATYDKGGKADLLLLPEVAVHEDDLDLIERMVDRTKAMAFCGLVFRHIPEIAGLVNTGRWIIPDQQSTGRTLVHIDQGKRHPTDFERKMGVIPYRPHQVVIQLRSGGSCADRRPRSAGRPMRSCRIGSKCRHRWACSWPDEIAAACYTSTSPAAWPATASPTGCRPDPACSGRHDR
jgi:hypothetical protein